MLALLFLNIMSFQNLFAVIFMWNLHSFFSHEMQIVVKSIKFKSLFTALLSSF